METERASTVRLRSFNGAAEVLGASELAADLRLVSNIAEVVHASGGRALVVGGFVRDSMMSQIHGTEHEAKDIDVEVYGVELERLEWLLGRHGRLNKVGQAFGILKLTNRETGNELDFSIPRWDSKVDVGHRGFVVTGDPHMSVAEAARRRDLTINALAMDPLTGEVIDEFGGIADLGHGLLRATDFELFADDPLRVLRIMQFAGRFGFSVDPKTADLCRGLNLNELATERIREEWEKLLLKSEYPSIGLQVAKDLGILNQLHPELDILDTIQQEPEWHPEGDVWEHTKLVVDAAARIVRDEGLAGDDALVVLLAALCHDLGKATTTELREKQGVQRLTAHGHESASVDLAKSFLAQIGVKKDTARRVLPIVREHLFHNHSEEISDRAIRRFAGRLHPVSIYEWDLVARADANGRGEEFQPITPSHAVYVRSVELQVDTQPAEPIVRGRDLIAHCGLKGGPHFKPILDFLYEAQLDGEFIDIETGLEYLKRHGSQLLAR